MSGRSVVGTLQAAYAVAGGPLAWLAQINIVYPLLATPCFPGPSRNLAFPAGAHWAFVLAVVVYFVLLAAAVLSGLVAFRLFNRLAASGHSTGNHFEGGGTGRMRFLAFSGILLGGGFSGVILLNGLALVMVPPCAI